MTSPTQRTLAECKRRGWTAAIVEKWNPHARIRQDLFGVIDIVAITPSKERVGGLCCVYKRPYSAGPGEFTCATCGVSNDNVPGQIVGIQACAGSSHAARLAKILAEPRARQWVDAGGRLEVWSWAKRGPRGKRKTWQLREEAVTYADKHAERSAA